jgi:hypothetical protein
VPAAAPLQTRVYHPTPTALRCMYSTKTFRLLIGPRGEGKSCAALFAMVYHAQKHPRTQWPLKVAAIRDTRRNLGITTAPTIKEWFPDGVASSWVGKDIEPEYAKIVLGKHQPPLLEFFFFGADNPKDFSKFQSFECDIVLMEEPAPAADISGGITGDALGMAVSSVRKSADPLILIAENPPDGGHWSAQLWELAGHDVPDWDPERLAAANRIRAQSEVFAIPKGENVHLDVKAPGYRERNRDMLLALGRQDLVNRLVEGKVGTVQLGTPVTPEYSSAYEVDAVPPVKAGERLLCSWDPAHSPACVLWRVTPGSYCDIVAAFQGVNMGVRQLIERTILPWMALWLPESYRLIHTGDPNTLNEEQSDSAMSAVRVILTLLGGEQWVPGPVGVEDRRLPMHDVLNRYHAGRPWLRVDRRHCKVLMQALQGGWSYPKDPSGRVIKDRWTKSQSSDVGEAFAYGCALLARRETATSAVEQWRKKLAQQNRGLRLVGGRGYTRTGA